MYQKVLIYKVFLVVDKKNKMCTFILVDSSTYYEKEWINYE